MKSPENAGRQVETLPLVPLRDMVVFPHMMAPFVVGRESSIRALEAALATPTKRLFLAAQRDPQLDEPRPEDIHAIGVVATVAQSLKLPNGHIKVMVEGQRRGQIEAFEQRGEYLAVRVETAAPQAVDPAELKEYMGKVLGLFEQYTKLSHHLAFESIAASIRMEEPERFADTLSAHLAVATAEKQTLLEADNVYEQLQRLQDLLEIEVEKVNIDRRINNKVKKQMEKAQKEYYLNEKIKAIHQELGRKDDRGDELEELKKKIAASGMPKEVREKAETELKRLEAMPPVSAEATVSRNYIEWLVGVPWKKSSRESKDISRAEKILNEDHYGLEKVKERILEFLAVRQLVQKTKGSIICFVGPPGVGKTSLAKSIARSLNRKFVRLSLGGVRDEAEIRGHRRTYIGAFPGQIIQMMKKAGTVNPVFLLDEVDKMSSDFRGDPASALLEVLDPEQNHSFLDHYLDVEFDLSKVMFIATANIADPIPPALKDRMEIIALSGYTPNEKIAIARQFLVHKQREANGLKDDQVEFSDEAILAVTTNYTREAGVRNLEREIGSICRKVARKIVQKSVETPVRITPENLREFLGQAALPQPAQGRDLGSRHRDGARLDGSRRRDPHDRDLAAQGKRKPDTDRLARRRDAGVGARGGLLRAQPRRDVRRGPELPREVRHPHPRSGGRDPQRRAVRWDHAGRLALLGRDEDSGVEGRRDDRGDHAAGKGAAGGRHQGQDSGGLPGGHPDDHSVHRERQGLGRPARGDSSGDGVPPRLEHGRSDPSRHGGGLARRHGLAPDAKPAEGGTVAH